MLKQSLITGAIILGLGCSSAMANEAIGKGIKLLHEQMNHVALLALEGMSYTEASFQANGDAITEKTSGFTLGSNSDLMSAEQGEKMAVSAAGLVTIVVASSDSANTKGISPLLRGAKFVFTPLGNDGITALNTSSDSVITGWKCVYTRLATDHPHDLRSMSVYGNTTNLLARAEYPLNLCANSNATTA